MLWCFRILLPCYFYFLFGKQAFVFQLSIVVIKIPFRRNSLLYNHPFCCPGSEALGIIVVSLPCTAYHWGSLIAFCFRETSLCYISTLLLKYTNRLFLPWLVSPPTRDNLGFTLIDFTYPCKLYLPIYLIYLINSIYLIYLINFIYLIYLTYPLTLFPPLSNPCRILH